MIRRLTGRLLLGVALLGAGSVPVAADVAYVTKVEGYQGLGGALTLPNVPAGTNGTLWIAVAGRDTGGLSFTVTFNGSTSGITSFGGGPLTTGGVDTQVWCGANLSGTHDVVITPGTGGLPIAGAALVFSGADTTTPCTNPQTSNTAAAGTATTAVSCAATGMVVDALGHRDDSVTVTSTQTVRTSQPPTSQGSILGKTSTAAGAASVTMGYTWSGVISHNHIAGCLVAASGGGGGGGAAGRDCTLLGVCE